MLNNEIVEKNSWNDIKITKKMINTSFHHDKPLIYFTLLYDKINILKSILKLDKNNYKNLNQNFLIVLCGIYKFENILTLLSLVSEQGLKYLFTPDNDYFVFYFINFASVEMIWKLLKYKKYIKFDTIINNEYILKIFLTKYYLSNETKLLHEIIKCSKSFIEENIYNFSIVIDSCLKGFNKSTLKILQSYFPDCITNNSNKLITPLIASIIILNDELALYIIEQMKKNKYDVDYNYFGINCALISAIKSNNNLILLKLLEFDDIDVNVYDNHKWSATHLICNKSSNINIENKKLILSKTDNFNVPNLSGNTVIHLLCLNGDIIKFKNILETKLIDLFYENKMGYNPLQYCKKKNISIIIKIVAKGFINNIDNISINDNKINNSKISHKQNLINMSEQCLQVQTEQCLKQLSQNIMINDNDIYLENEPLVNYSLFTSTDYDSFIYLEYYKQKYNINILRNNNTKLKYELIMKNDNEKIGKIFNRYIDLYKSYNNLQNLSIFWYDVNNYFYSNEIKNLLLKSKNIVFIYVNIVDLNNDHANCLIIDHNKKQIIHFEPFGTINNKKLNDFDEYFKQYFNDIFSSYVYYAPKDFMSVNSFQMLSNETSDLNIKIGDIGGFCLAWTLWFLELYLNNKNTSLEKLINNSIRKIIDTKSLFSDYIRSYANKLTNFRSAYLSKINYPAERIFNIHKSYNELHYILNALNK